MLELVKAADTTGLDEDSSIELNRLPLIDYDNHPAFRARERSLAKEIEAVNIISPVIKASLDQIQNNIHLFDRRIKAHTDTKINSLARTGAVALDVPSAMISALTRVCRPVHETIMARINEKRRSRLRFRDTQIFLFSEFGGNDTYRALYPLIFDAIITSGCAQIVRAYFPNCSVQICQMMYKISVENQPFFFEMFDCDDAPVPRTSGLHIDSNCAPILNGVLYLSEVGELQGPLCNVDGSNHWVFDPADRAIRKSMDNRGIRREMNSHFIDLPQNYRRRANFGHHLIDGSPTSNSILSKITRYTSDKGHMVLFDPDAVHCGGRVESGKRFAIMFALRISDAESPHRA